MFLSFIVADCWNHHNNHLDKQLIVDCNLQSSSWVPITTLFIPVYLVRQPNTLWHDKSLILCDFDERRQMPWTRTCDSCQLTLSMACSVVRRPDCLRIPWIYYFITWLLLWECYSRLEWYGRFSLHFHRSRSNPQRQSLNRKCVRPSSGWSRQAGQHARCARSVLY